MSEKLWMPEKQEMKTFATCTGTSTLVSQHSAGCLEKRMSVLFRLIFKDQVVTLKNVTERLSRKVGFKPPYPA